MATEIKIHRGNQIGGCVTEVWTETTRILIDFGEELPGSKNKTQFELDWNRTPDGKELAVGAVFFTHYHGDHIGRFAEACRHTDVYMSKLSREVLVNIHGYLAENLPKLAGFQQEKAEQLREDAEVHGKALNILNGGRVHTFQPQEKEMIRIGDICVKPFWVDHSAADACMFLIDTKDKRILHTGDFRGHGIHGQEGETICKTVRSMAAEKRINVLITEGTMMSRRDEKPYSEEDLLQDVDRLFERHKHIFLVISSTNLDSLQTFYQAASKWKLPIYVYNGYVKSQLETLGKYASENWGAPIMKDVEQIRAQSQLKEGCVAIIKANARGMKLIERCADCHPVVIYSMWPGYYYRKLDEDLCEFVEACKEKSIPVYPLTDTSYGSLHTSGHASPELIAEVVNAAAPKELFPIHTEDAWEFLRLDISEQLKEGLQERMMQAGEKAGYSRENDHRCLSETALKKFLPGGSHYKFIELVKNHPGELAFCFRGNSGNAAVVYYRNHAAFHITARGYVKFNFDHARYLRTEAWIGQRKRLKEFGYSFDKKQSTQPKDGSESIGYVTMSPERVKELTAEALEDLYSNGIRAMIDSFFDKKGLVEKSVQQQLFLHPDCKKLRDGYFIYDLEFSQPYGKLLGCKNQPDMLAIRFDGEGRPKRMAFVEVKSKPEALDGASGLGAHIRGMEHYPDCLLPIRSRDAYNILEQYRLLGLLNIPAGTFREEDFKALPKEILLIFTGQDTIEALRKESGEKEARFLLNMGYAPLYDFPEITLDGRPLPMEVYRRDFILNGEPVHGET